MFHGKMNCHKAAEGWLGAQLTGCVTVKAVGGGGSGIGPSFVYANGWVVHLYIA
jgi:hypothetical protein